MERSGAERSAGNESFEIVNFRAWFMRGTREERTRAYASSYAACWPFALKPRREEKEWQTGEERRGGVNDRNAARSQRDAYYRGSALTPAEKIVKGLRHTVYGCWPTGMRTDFFIARNSCRVA